MACFGFGSETCFDVLPPDILSRTPPIGTLAICVLCAGSYRIEGAEDFHLAVVGLHRQAGFVGHLVRFVDSQVHFVGRQVRFVDRLGAVVVVGWQQNFDVAEVAHFPLGFVLDLLALALGQLTQ